MHILKCPHCDQIASSFLKTYFWGYFPGNHPNRCQNCSKPIKYSINCYLQCGALFLVLLIIYGYLLGPVLAVFERSPDSNAIIERIPAIDILGMAGWLLEITIVLLILYNSFEIPARYFGVKVFKKRWYKLLYNQSVQVTARAEPFWLIALELTVYPFYWSQWKPWLSLTSALCQWY